jgi:hypothetical protein
MSQTRTAANGVALLSLVFAAALPLSAQQPVTPRSPAAQPGTPHYDVVLEVPELSVGSLELTVSRLRAQLSLDANVASLVSISAGAVASIDHVELGLYGVLAEAYAYVDLDNVSAIVRRVVATIDRNPRILTRLLESADSVVRTVGGVADTALQPGGVVSQAVSVVGQTLEQVTRPDGLLAQTVNAAGQTVQQVVTRTGSLVEYTADATGRIVNERTVGSALQLPVVGETRNASNQLVRTVRDPAGNLIELVLNAAGDVTGARVTQRTGGR